jgi:pimeloyl-ACP methyl ester carboxylesterase
MKHAYAETPSGQIYYDSEGKGEPVVCLHQTTWSSREYANLIPKISKSFKVIAPDLLGYGLSDPAPQKWSRVEDWVSSVIQFLDALGIKKTSLIGSHAGAMLVLELAASHPGRISKLVLYGCGIYNKNAGRNFDPNSPWSKQVQTATLAERIALARKLQKAKPEIPVSGLHFFDTWNDLIRLDPAADAETIQNAFLACVRTYDKRSTANSGSLNDLEYNLERSASLVKCPSLLAIGSRDVIVPPIFKTPESVAKIIPRCKAARIEGAGNFGLSTAAAPMAKQILAFL